MILLTGATGSAGSFIANEFVRERVPVRILVRQTAFIDAAKAASVRHVIKFSGLDARLDTTFPFGLMHKEIEESRKIRPGYSG
jgi:uncharacterized protein YbjT (DUF2867 family)